VDSLAKNPIAQLIVPVVMGGLASYSRPAARGVVGFGTGLAMMNKFYQQALERERLRKLVEAASQVPTSGVPAVDYQKRLLQYATSPSDALAIAGRIGELLRPRYFSYGGTVISVKPGEEPRILDTTLGELAAQRELETYKKKQDVRKRVSTELALLRHDLDKKLAVFDQELKQVAGKQLTPQQALGILSKINSDITTTLTALNTALQNAPLDEQANIQEQINEVLKRKQQVSRYMDVYMSYVDPSRKSKVDALLNRGVSPLIIQKYLQ